MLINRAKELELCRRILNGDRSAPRELAEHYRECNHSLANTLLRTINADGDLEVVRQHAPYFEVGGSCEGEENVSARSAELYL